jgi:hypothetical protein
MPNQDPIPQTTTQARDPHDGQPFYCTLCGAGWNEYGACEEPDCKLESLEVAQLRAQRKRKTTSDQVKTDD